MYRVLLGLPPAPAQVGPFHKTAAAAFQLGQGHLHRAVGGAGRRKDRLKTAQGFIQIGAHARQKGEGAYAAGGVAHQGFHLISRDHPGLFPEFFLKAMVIHPGIPRRHDQHGAAGGEEGEGLGDPGALAAQGSGCQLHRGAGFLQFPNGAGKAGSFQCLAHCLYRHGKSLLWKR